MSETAPASNTSPHAKLFSALARAQAKFVQPEKNKEVEVFKEGKLLYKTRYADLKNVIESFRTALTSEGVSFSQKTRIGEGGRWRLVLSVRHESGELDESEMPIALEGMEPQQVGSQLTYLKRYQAAAYFGIAADDDDDANGAHGNQASFGDRKRTRGETSPRPASPAKPPAASEPAKGKMATADEIKALVHECEVYGISVDDQKKMLTAKIGRASWKDLTAVELLLAKEGVDELCKAKEASMRSSDEPPPPSPEDQPQEFPADDLDAALDAALEEPPQEKKPSAQASKEDLDEVWNLGTKKGMKPKEITDLVLHRLGKMEWAKLTNFELNIVRNAIESKGGAK